MEQAYILPADGDPHRNIEVGRVRSAGSAKPGKVLRCLSLLLRGLALPRSLANHLPQHVGCQRAALGHR